MVGRVLLGNKGSDYGLYVSAATKEVTTVGEVDLIFSTTPPNAQGSGISTAAGATTFKWHAAKVWARDVSTSPLARSDNWGSDWSDINAASILHSQTSPGWLLQTSPNWVYECVKDSTGSPTYPVVFSWTEDVTNSRYEFSYYRDGGTALFSGPTSGWDRADQFHGLTLKIVPRGYNSSGGAYVSGTEYGGVFVGYAPEHRALHVVICNEGR